MSKMKRTILLLTIVCMTLAADGESLDFGRMQLFYRGLGYVTEGMKVSVPARTFAQITNAQQVKMKLGPAEFRLRDPQLIALRDLGRRSDSNRKQTYTHPRLWVTSYFTLHSFAVLFALAVIAALWWLVTAARRDGLKPDLLLSLGLWAVMGGILGAKLLLVSGTPCVD